MAYDELSQLLASAGNAPFAAGESSFGLSAFGADAVKIMSAAGLPTQAAINAAAMMQKRAEIHAAQTPLNNAPRNNWLGQMPLGINSGTVGGSPFIVPVATTQQISGTPVIDFEPFRYVSGWPFPVATAAFLMFQPQMGINGSFASGAGIDAATLQPTGNGLTIKFPLVKANTPINTSCQNIGTVASPFTSTMYGHVQQ